MSEPPAKILLATDGSGEARLAAEVAVGLAASEGAQLHVVTVGPGYPLYTLPESTARFSEVFEREQRETREVLEAQVRGVESLGGTVAEAHQRFGRPDEEIIGVAEKIGAGMIVVGSRGLGGMRRALLGSVSDSVIRHAPCPVLIVRPER